MYHATRWLCAFVTMFGVSGITHSPFLALCALALYVIASALMRRPPRRLIR